MQCSVVYCSLSRDLTNSEAFQPVPRNQAVGYFNQLGFTVSLEHSLSFSHGQENPISRLGLSPRKFIQPDDRMHVK
jgi:hypothetical protein